MSITILQVIRRVYRRHFETMHCVQRPVTCPICSKTFKHRYSLDCHQRQSHHSERGKKKEPWKSCFVERDKT